MSVFNLLRTVATSAAAVVEGGWNLATSASDGVAVELKPGDPAPLFTLEGSDGQVYRLADFIGREPVVVVWFPKAFTGG